MPSVAIKSDYRVLRRFLSRIAATFLMLFLVAHLVPASAQRTLSIRPIAQQTPVWCWAAVAEMIFRYLNYPSINPAGLYQCGIVASLGGPCWSNCSYVPYITGIGNAYNFRQVLENYPNVASQVYGRQFPGLSLDIDDALDPNDIIQEIDSGRPIVGGISPGGLASFLPSGISQHVVLIVGYRHSGNSINVIVNDPMPMADLPFNPYIQAGGVMINPGRYEISYSRFVSQLGYKDSIVGFERN